MISPSPGGGAQLLSKAHGNFRLVNVLCAVLALTICALIPDYAAAAREKDHDVWFIKQTGVLMGPYDVYVNNSGIRLENAKSHVIVVAAAPAWKVIAFNYDTKSVWTGSVTNYHPTAGTRKFMTIASDVPPSSAIKFPLSKPFSQFGLKGTKYFTDERWTGQQQILFEKKLISRQYPSSASYFGTYDAIKSRQPITLLENLYDTPRMGLLPLDFHYRKMSGSLENVLTTVSVSKKAAPLNWLSVPGGLRAVNSVEEVNMDTTGRQGMDQWLDNIDTHR